jgi:hypothetical protein
MGPVLGEYIPLDKCKCAGMRWSHYCYHCHLFVLGLTFGTRIRDWPLVKTSFLNEILALLGCVLIGALVSLGASFTSLAEDE